MAIQTWVQTANSGQPSGLGKGEALATSVTLTDISPGGKTKGPLTIPANYLEVGKIIRFTAAGILGTTGKPKLKMGLYWGGVAGVALAETVEVEAAIETTTQSWFLDATSIVQSIGESGKIITQGNITGIEGKSTLSTSASTTMMPETTTTGGEATINTIENKIITVGAQWGTSSSSNTITCMQFIVEFLN